MTESLLDLEEDLLEYATDEEKAAYYEALAIERALVSPLDYAERSMPAGIKRFPHTVLINQYAVAHVNHALYRGGISLPAVWTVDEDDPEEGRWLHPETGEEAVEILVLSMPPQHGKSHIITETMPAWHMSRWPEKSVILTGYEANFARGFSKKNRDKIVEAKIPGIELDPETAAADHWSLKGHSGAVVSAGAGGPITGKGAHLIVIDDPVKNSQEALSETDRKAKWDWWISTVKSRIRKGGIVIVIQTRWHEDDLAGRIIRNEPSVFSLNIPALAFEGDPDVDGVARDPDTGERDPLGRKPGEALCPTLHTRSHLEGRRDSADTQTEEAGLGGALWFSCLYQGKPTILGGGILPGPYLRYTAEQVNGQLTYVLTDKAGVIKRVPADELYRFVTADLAISTKTRADWSVFTLWGWSLDGDLLMLDYERVKMEAPDHEEKAREWWDQWAQRYGRIRFMGIEDKTFGSALIQVMVRHGGIHVRPLKADTDKISRALAYAGPLMVAGHVYFPVTAAANEAIKECKAFPNGTHDDIVDTLSYAGICTPLLPRRPKPKAEHDTTPDGRARRNLAKLDGKKKRRHPVLGRW